MQKIFCDKCGKEINRSEEGFYSADVRSSYNGYRTPENSTDRVKFDICDKCNSEFLSVIQKIREDFCKKAL